MPKMPRAKESLSLTQNQPQLLTQELCRSDPGSDDHFPISVSETLVKRTLSSPLRSLSLSLFLDLPLAIVESPPGKY